VLAFDAKFHLVHFGDAEDFDVNVWLEVARILWVNDKACHFVLQSLDICDASFKVAEDGNLFAHSFAAGDVLNPETVENNVWDLDNFPVLDTLEDGEEKGDVFDGELVVGHQVYTIANVVRMLDEDENTASEN
jgi:hypothetical protein